MILTIASPDKITISMFIDFYKSLYDSSVKVYDLNCLFSSDILKTRMIGIKKQDDLLSKPEEFFTLVYYKMKPKTKNIADIVLHGSDFVISFDTYSNYPEIIKNRFPDRIQPIIDRWNTNIKRMNEDT